MPIYEYQCHACGKVNEVMQKIGAEAPEACTECSGGPLTKLISRSGFVLKGSGWYVTDFRGGSGGGSKPVSQDNSSTDSGSKDPGSTDSGSKDSGSSSSDSGSKTETKASAAGGCGSGCGHNH